MEFGLNEALASGLLLLLLLLNVLMMLVVVMMVVTASSVRFSLHVDAPSPRSRVARPRGSPVSDTASSPGRVDPPPPGRPSVVDDCVNHSLAGRIGT